MEFSPESLLILVQFFLPGFVATYIHSEKVPRFSREKTLFELSLGSLASSVLILAVQLLLLAVLKEILPGLGNLLAQLLAPGVLYLYLDRTVEVTLLVLGWLLSSYALSIVFGLWFHPIEVVAHVARTRSGISDKDTWRQILQIAPVAKSPELSSFVLIRLKSGICYQGWLRTFELERKHMGARSFGLVSVRRWNTVQSMMADEPPQDMAAVVLSSDNIESVEAWWWDPAQYGVEPARSG